MMGSPLALRARTPVELERAGFPEARGAAEAAEAAAEEAFLELPRLADDADSEEEAEPALEPFALDEPDFEVDYRLWLIEYADGSTRTFDSHAGTLA